MGKNILIVIDMQNDFVYGKFSNKNKQNIVKNVKLLNNWEYLVFCVEIALKMLYNHYDYKIGNFGLIYRRS